MASGSLATRSVDIAVLCNDIARPAVLDDSVTVIDLAPICPPLSISNFMKMFYKNGPAAKFSMLNDTDVLSATSQIGDGTYSSLAQHNYAVSETGLVAIPLNDYVSFSCQTLEGAGGNNSAFNLKNAILGAYSSNKSGVGVDSNCWAPCSLMAIQTQMNKLKHLYDICNVECSRTFYEAMQEISSLFDGDGGSSIVNTRVSVVFTNQNPVVHDVIVRFNFQVELLCVNAKPLIDTPLSSLYDGIDNVPVFRGGELIGSQPLKNAFKCGNPTAAEMVKGSDSLAYFFNKSVELVGQEDTGGPSPRYWTQVTESDCLPACFPFDVSTGEVYVLTVMAPESPETTDPSTNNVVPAIPLSTEPLPVILTQSHKLRNAGSQSSAQKCSVQQLIVVNVYINLACGKKAAYFPASTPTAPTAPTAPYAGIDPADIFFHPRGAISMAGAAPLPVAAAAAVAPVICKDDLSVDLENATLLPNSAPACVGDLYLLGTQVNLFMQHTNKCNISVLGSDAYSPIVGIDGSSLGGSETDKLTFITALQVALGNLTTGSTTEATGTYSWGITVSNNKLDFSHPVAANAFTKAELACKPFAMVITDVCALPSN